MARMMLDLKPPYFSLATEDALMGYFAMRYGFEAFFRGSKQKTARVVGLFSPWADLTFHMLPPDGTWRKKYPGRREVYEYLDDFNPGWRSQIPALYRYDVPELSPNFRTQPPAPPTA